MIKNPYFKNVLSALAVSVFGFILLILTFIFNFLVQSFIHKLIPTKTEMIVKVLPLVDHTIFVVIILIISWYIFKSRLGDIYKATYSLVPLSVVFVNIGIFLYPWPIILYALSALLFGAILLYLYRTRRNWIYYYTVILMLLLLLIMNLTGTDI